MNVNRGLIFWGVALISAGAMALAVQSGAVADEAARGVWRYWPAMLIVIGIAVVAARSPFAVVTTVLAAVVVGGIAGTLAAGNPKGIGVACGGTADGRAGESGDLVSGGSVELEFSCGDLSVSTAAGSEWSVDARYAGDAEPEITSTDDSLRAIADESGVFGFAERRQQWDVVLPADAELDVDVAVNAAESRLDLARASLGRLEVDANAGDLVLDAAGTSIGELTIDANAGSARIDTDGSTSFTGAVSINAGSLRLCVPDSAAVSITIDDENITFSHNLDESGLQRRGDTWNSGDDAAITLEVTGNAASFELNPEDGCS